MTRRTRLLAAALALSLAIGSTDAAAGGGTGRLGVSVRVSGCTAGADAAALGVACLRGTPVGLTVSRPGTWDRMAGGAAPVVMLGAGGSRSLVDLSPGASPAAGEVVATVWF